MSVARRAIATAFTGLLFAVQMPQVAAADTVSMSSGPTFADLADMADSAPQVIRARVQKIVRVADERAANRKPGTGRFYIEADTVALISGPSGIGGHLRYLVDLPLDARGKGPDLKKQDVILFSNPVPGRPDEVRLVSPDAQLVWTPALDAKLRGLLRDLVSPGAPGHVTGVRELIYVPGTLAGQGETQIFLKTQEGTAASITVRHQPGRPVVWGASFSELVADVTRPPEPETLEWYRLACFLPDYPPAGTNLSEGYDAKRQAQDDYRRVLADLGPCTRSGA